MDNLTRVLNEIKNVRAELGQVERLLNKMEYLRDRRDKLAGYLNYLWMQTLHLTDVYIDESAKEQSEPSEEDCDFDDAYDIDVSPRKRHIGKRQKKKTRIDSTRTPEAKRMSQALRM